MTVTLDDLVRLLPDESVYPNGVVHPIRPRLHGRSFFPGGCGLAFGNGQSYPAYPIMLVGQDFDSHDNWLRLDDAAMQRSEERSATWRRIVDLESEGLLDLRRGFYTNALLGVRIAKRNTGTSPALGEDVYQRASLECLEEQIQLLRPTVVVALGEVPTTLLARHFGLVTSSWSPGNRVWESIDSKGLQFVPGVTRAEHTFAFATCVHPSYQHLNARRRSWRRNGVLLVGIDAHRAIWIAIQEHDVEANRLRGPSHGAST